MQFSSQMFGSSAHSIKAIFSAYSLALFSCALIYFLARIIGYKIGVIKTLKHLSYRPRRRYPGKFYRRGYRSKNNLHHDKKGRRKKKEKERVKPMSSSLLGFTSVPNVDERCRSRDMLHFNTDSSTMVCDNSPNNHICNRRDMFVGEIKKVLNQQVATIGGKGHQPSYIGTVQWIWRDDSGKPPSYLVENVLFPPQYPINCRAK